MGSRSQVNAGLVRLRLQQRSANAPKYNLFERMLCGTETSMSLKAAGRSRSWQLDHFWKLACQPHLPTLHHLYTIQQGQQG